jgi:Winged helix DNA-binding domain
MPGLIETRLHHQGLTGPPRASAHDVVAWLGAVQAQDYAGAAWALGLRARGLTMAAVDAALGAGAIIRTHVLRPTWHFVSPADLRWMLALTGPRVKALMKGYDARLELDARTYTRARKVFARALEGGQHLTRAELGAALARAKIVATGQRLAHLVMDAELAAVVCSGPRRGTQFTYALVDAHVPAVAPLTREAALAALATRYFRSHGPATAHDFSWWSGLTMGDARAAIALADIGAAVLSEPPAPDRARGAHYLLPNYDEFLIAYRHRDAVLDPARARNFGVFTSAEYPHQIVLHGRIAGSWRREVTAREARLTLRTYAKASKAEAKALGAEAARLGAFFGVPAVVRD